MEPGKGGGIAGCWLTVRYVPDESVWEAVEGGKGGRDACADLGLRWHTKGPVDHFGGLSPAVTL